MIKYIISILVFFSCIVLTIFSSGGTVLPYIDIPSLIIVGIFPFLFISIVFGFKEMASAFKISFKKEPERDKLIKAINFFKAYCKATWISGFIAMLIGVIAMLIWLEDKTKLGPNMAVALISLLYCGIINVVIIIPFTVYIKGHLDK